MKKKQIHCPYCGAKASLRPASAVYGTATKVPDSYLYVCDRYPRCDSYVGAHKRTKEPMGTLANGDLRNKRIQAHKAFDWMWKSGLMTKWQAYKWMQGKLALTDEQAHIAKFSEYSVTKQIFRRDKRSSDEQKVMLLANQAILSTAEMIKCAELNTFAFGSEDELIDTLYHDEYTTSENIAHSVRFLPQCRPVITSVANLYLRKQIIFERM